MDIFVFVLLIWIVFGAIGGMIMSNKGQSGCGGFALGFLLGPLGLVIALVMPTDHKTLEHRSLQTGDTRKCPACAEVIKVEARKCRFCGTDVAPMA